MRVLRQEFEIMFDIEKLVNGHEFNTGERLDFGQFC